MPKPVVYAQLHAGFFIPGMKAGGNFKETLPPSDKSLKDFRMTLQDSGALLLEWEDGGYTQSFTVAAANIKGVKHAPTKLEAAKPSITPKVQPVSDTKNN